MGETYRKNKAIKDKKIASVARQSTLIKTLDELNVEIVPRIPPNTIYDGFILTTWFKSYLSSFIHSKSSNPIIPFPEPNATTHKGLYVSIHKKNFRWATKTAKVYEKFYAELENPIIHTCLNEGVSLIIQDKGHIGGDRGAPPCYAFINFFPISLEQPIVINYIYVKEAFHRFGLATALIKAALNDNLDQEVLISHQTNAILPVFNKLGIIPQYQQFSKIKIPSLPKSIVYGEE